MAIAKYTVTDPTPSDGPWSSFPLQIGNHVQDIRAFVSTASTFTWAIEPEGCPANYVADCANSRGFLYYTNESLTWTANSVYSLGIEDNLGEDTTGNAGWDDVTAGWQGATTATANHSVVFTIADSSYWIGGFGLNPRPTNFTNLVDPQPSFMTQLYETNQTPSISYGYTAGNKYRNNGVFGSLVFGGYDQNRFEATNLTFPFYSDISRDLLVNVQAIKTEVSGTTSTNLLPGGSIAAFIDSTTPWLWLPKSACAAFEDAFGITYNSEYDLYLVNDTLHTTLSNANYNVTFTLGPEATGGQTIDIVFPYGAFDLTIDYPYISDPNTSYYFPLKRADNDTQFTLGRTFLQEAYLIADYQRENFTVAPCTWGSNVTSSDVIPILSAAYAKSSGRNGGKGSSFSAGDIAGVVVAIVAVIAILGLILFFLRRRKNTQKRRVAELEAKEQQGIGKTSADHGAGTTEEHKPFMTSGELGGGEIHELTAPYKSNAQEMDSPYRVDPNKHGYSEMEGGEYFGPGKGYAHEMQGSQQAIYEMAGSDVHEMAAQRGSVEGEREK